MIFEPGVIKIEHEREFGDLKAAIEKVFATDRVSKYLKALDGRKVRVRDMDAAFAANAIDAAAEDKACLLYTSRFLPCLISAWIGWNAKFRAPGVPLN